VKVKEAQDHVKEMPQANEGRLSVVCPTSFISLGLF